MARTKNFLHIEIKKKAGDIAINAIKKAFPDIKPIQIKRILINAYARYRKII